jgi:hypothetical protein
MSNFMEIRSTVLDLLYAIRRTDRQTDLSVLIGCERAHKNFNE